MTPPEPLDTTFFGRDALEVAPALLGARLRIGAFDVAITEVEAYTADDPASHSFRGRTPRNAPMFGPPGRWYVYLIYGVHLCLNVVTGVDGDGQAVLLRSGRIEGVAVSSTTGPGRLSRSVGADLSWNERPVVGWRDCDDVSVPAPGPRVGITKAVDWPRRWRC